MLRMFESEDPQLLIRLFGREDVYRPITDIPEALRQRSRGYLWWAGDGWVHPSLAFG